MSQIIQQEILKNYLVLLLFYCELTALKITLFLFLPF